MHVITPEQRARSRAFDDVIEAADKVLKHPYVRQGLGEIATELTAINDGAFLPNFRGEIISIPRTEQDTEHIAVVPITYRHFRRRFWKPPEYRQAATTYMYDASVIQPTPKRRQLSIERMSASGLEQDAAEKILDGQTERVELPYRARLPGPGAAHSEYLYARHRRSRTRQNTRPVIFTNFPPDMYSFVERGIIMGHEYAHIPDLQSSAEWPEDMKGWIAASELHANHIEAEIRLALRAAGISPYNLAEDRKTFDVELLRREHNPLDDPYATPPEIMEGMHRIGALAAV